MIKRFEMTKANMWSHTAAVLQLRDSEREHITMGGVAKITLTPNGPHSVCMSVTLIPITNAPRKAIK